MSGAPGAHADPHDPFQKRAAVAIALFTVVLAFANMLTNQARTRAILSSNRATNQWSYYQSKSVKLMLTQIRRDAAEEGSAKAKELDAELKRYEQEKTEIRQRAEGLVGDEAEAEHKEHYYEYSATVVELAIVLAGIALLMSGRRLLLVAALVASCSLGLIAYTSFLLPHPQGHGAPKPSGSTDHVAESTEH